MCQSVESVIRWAKGFVSCLLISCMIAVFFGQEVVAADNDANQRGKPITLVVGAEAGTGYDIYGRLAAQNISRFLPHSPPIVIQYMPAAGGLSSFFWLATVAPSDGSVIATFPFTPVAQQFLGGTLKVSPDKLSWIANLDESVGVCVASRASGISTVQDLLGPKVIFAGIEGAPEMFPMTLKNLLGAQGKLVLGYRGSTEMKLAIQRGEADAACGVTLQTVTSQWGDLLASGDIKIVLHFSPHPQPTLPGIPSVYSLAKSDDDRQVFDLVYGSTALGRLFAAPNGLSPANLQLYRQAFMAMVTDPAFLSDVRKAKLTLASASGDEVEKQVGEYVSAKPETVERARRAIENTQQ